MFPLKIYDIYEGKCIFSFPGMFSLFFSTFPPTNFFAGHHDLVYDIMWSPHDDAILTASSDGTAKIWPFTFPAKSGAAVVTLQHTCYVYAAQFFPNQDMSVRIVATGAYHEIVRGVEKRREWWRYPHYNSQIETI
jgi:WD40 repeat protein